MSFIRCLSNPERLYIWEDVGGFVAIVRRMSPIYTVATEDWYKAIAKGWDIDYAPFVSPTLTVQRTKNDKIQFILHNHENKTITMWLVTWMYICSHNPITKKRKRHGTR